MRQLQLRSGVDLRREAARMRGFCLDEWTYQPAAEFLKQPACSGSRRSDGALLPQTEQHHRRQGCGTDGAPAGCRQR